MNRTTMVMTRSLWLLAIEVAVLTGMISAQSKPDMLLVANQGNRTVTLLDATTGSIIKTVATHGNHAHEIVVSPDGTVAYLPIYGDSGVGRPGTDVQTIEVLDLASRSITQTIDLGRPLRPHWAGFGRDGMLYVSAELAESVDVIDSKTHKVVASIPTGAQQSHMVALSHDGKRAYTSNVRPGSVSALDVSQRKLIKVIPVSEAAQRISISANDQYVFTADQTQPRVAVIDAATLKLTNWIALPAIGFGSTVSRDGKWLLVTLPSADQVAVISIASIADARVIKTIAVPAHPQEILIRHDQPVAYVSCNDAAKVAVMNLQSWSVERLLDAGPGADGLGFAAGK